MATFQTLGIVRRLDPLNRVVIPKEFMRTLNWKPGDAVEILASKTGEVLVRKYKSSDADIDVIK
jgi:AbrB family looped-hinge helix DNA binding protein